MNEQDITETREIIKDIMEDYMFENINNETIRNMRNDIAANIGVNELYDYVLDVIPFPDDGNIKVELAMKSHEADDFTLFTARYDTDADLIEDNKNKAYEHAMEIING